MPSKKSKGGGAVPESRGMQQATGANPRKKRIAVDQYMSALREIPPQLPARRGGKPLQPGAVPTLVQQTAPNEWYCEVCRKFIHSFTDLNQHQAGNSHRKHVLLGAINFKRFLFSAFILGS